MLSHVALLVPLMQISSVINKLYLETTPGIIKSLTLAKHLIVWPIQVKAEDVPILGKNHFLRRRLV